VLDANAGWAMAPAKFFGTWPSPAGRRARSPRRPNGPAARALAAAGAEINAGDMEDRSATMPGSAAGLVC
jgi:hypothetical protein